MDGESHPSEAKGADCVDATDTGASGYRVLCPANVQHHTRVRMLTSKIRSNRKRWLLEAERPLDLLFFRAIFSELSKRQASIGDFDEVVEGQISLEAFQIAMERLFFILGDYAGFDARQYDSNGDCSVTWSEFFRVYRERELMVRLSLTERIFLTMEYAESCYLAQFISNLILLTILVSSLSFILGTLPECKFGLSEWCSPFKSIEACCLLLFTIEYFLRLLTCWAVRPVIGDQAKLLEMVISHEAIPKAHPLRRLISFVFAPSNLIDLAAILPGVVSRVTNSEGGAFVVLRLVRLTRILRAFKSPALSEAVKVITKTMQQSTQALYILAFNLVLGIIIFGSLMYMAEGGPELNALGLGGRWNAQHQVFERVVTWTWNHDTEEWMEVWGTSHFQSIPHACWWAMVTVATVGYGDQVPTTALGKVVAVGAMLFSLVILALPVGVVGGTFSSVWEQCDKEKMAQEQQLKWDLKFVAHELSRLDPIIMSRLMLIEVWNDSFQSIDNGARPPPSTFMGEAKVQLDIDPHTPCSRVCTLNLSTNCDVAKRRITGKVTIRYDWTPGENTASVSLSLSRNSVRHSGVVQPLEPASSVASHLSGNLQVTLISAENLINLNAHQKRVSNPYCMIFCYPRRSDECGLPEPCIWRTPTVKGSLSPYWGVSHEFEFEWRNESPDRPGMRRLDSAEMRHKLTELQSQDSPRRGQASPVIRDDRTDDLVSLAKELTSQLHQHKAELRHVRRAVRCLGRTGSNPGGAVRTTSHGAPPPPPLPAQQEPSTASTSASTTAAGSRQPQGLHSPKNQLSSLHQQPPQLQQSPHRHAQHQASQDSLISDQKRHHDQRISVATNSASASSALDGGRGVGADDTEAYSSARLSYVEQDVDGSDNERLSRVVLPNWVQATLILDSEADSTSEPWQPPIEV